MVKKTKNSILKMALSMVAATSIVTGSAFVNVEAEEGGYAGITIGDGDYSDWDSVVKYDGQYGVDRVAMVWDGYYVYLYFENFGKDQGSGQPAGNWNSVTWAGENHSGNFAIRTDYGEMIVNLATENNMPVVRLDGKSGYTCGAEVYVNNQEWFSDTHIWEVKIPTEMIPTFTDTISLGYYMGDTIISEVANLNMPEEFINTGVQDDVIYDGVYMDWKNYPHTTIAYSTNGTHETKIDANGALYSANGILYGYVQTEMPQHTISGEAAVAFTQAVTIKVNDNNFWPRVAEVSADGLINWNPQIWNLPAGEYRFKVFDSQGWSNAASIYNLDENNVCYGDMIVTIGSGHNQCEYALDEEKLAAKFGMTPEEIKTFDAQYGRLGQQWVSCAGASTSPWIGCLIAAGLAGIGLFLNRKKLFY